MAQVPFLTNIILYRNVPRAPNYRDTVYFANRTEQLAWFEQFDKINYYQQMFQRVGKNRVRLEGNPRQYEGVNYMRFQNYFEGSQNKLWYAFVLETEYINEHVFEVTYQIDVMQSFLVGVDYNLLDCYVEREHQATDVAGDNLLKEPVNIGDYVLNPVSGSGANVSYLQEPVNSLTPLTYVVAVMPILDNNADGGVVITLQPTDQFEVQSGANASFRCEAVDSDGSHAGLNYRWWYKLPNSADWTPIMDTEDNRYTNYDFTDTTGSAGGCTLTVHQVYAGDNTTMFRCVVTDEFGYTATSKWVGLTVAGASATTEGGV